MHKPDHYPEKVQPHGREALEVGGVAQAVDELELALAPQRDLVSSALLGHQIVHAVDRQEHRDRLLQAQADMELVTGFGEEVLPTARDQWREKRFREDLLRIDKVVFWPVGLKKANRLRALTVWGDYPDEHTMYDGRVSSPFFVIGHRSTAVATEILLVMPARENALNVQSDYVKTYAKGSWVRGTSGYGPIESTTQAPRLFAATMKNEDFQRLQIIMKERLVQYTGNVGGLEDIPAELQETAVTRQWPNEHSEPTTLGKKEEIPVSGLTQLMVEDLVDRYPIVDFDVLKTMLILAIDLNKSSNLKTLLKKRLTEFEVVDTLQNI